MKRMLFIFGIRPEAVEACAVKLAGTDPLKITGEGARLVEDEQEYRRTSRIHNPDWDGRASERITGAITAYFGDTRAESVDRARGTYRTRC